MRVHKIDKGLEPGVAMWKAVAAYNHSIHNVTGFTSLGVLFGLSERKRDYEGKAVDEETTKKIISNKIRIGKLWGKV